MASDNSAGKARIVALLAALWVAGGASGADDNALDLLVGRWDAHVETLRPQRSELSYTETYRWVLDHQFLEGHTTHKSDGTEDIVYGTYDDQAKGYPFWIFSSSGTYTVLPPAAWDASRRTLEWKNPPSSDIAYHTRVVFGADGTRHWTVIVKDWKGTVLLQQVGSAVRRGD